MDGGAFSGMPKLTRLVVRFWADSLEVERTARKLGREEFAALIEVPSSTYQSWRGGRGNPTLFELVHAFEILGWDAAAFERFFGQLSLYIDQSRE